MDDIQVDSVRQESKRLAEVYWEYNKNRYGTKLKECSAGQALLSGSEELQMAAVFAAYEHPNCPYNVVRDFVPQLLARSLPFIGADLDSLFELASSHPNHKKEKQINLIKPIERFAQKQSLTLVMIAGLRELQESISDYGTDNRKLKMRISELLGDTPADLPDPESGWANAALADLDQMTPPLKAAWMAVFAHAKTADGPKPSAKWIAKANTLQSEIGEGLFILSVMRWMSLAAPPSPVPLTVPKAEGEGFVLYQVPEWSGADLHHEKNISLLKGLAWYYTGSTEPKVARSLRNLAEVGFHKIPGVGPWAARVGNAAIWVLGTMNGAVAVGQLTALRTKLRDRNALKLIAASIETAASKSGMTVDELEDLAVPTGGLGLDGVREETFGTEGSAKLSLDASTGQTRTEWFGADGKLRKAVPAGAKRDFAAEVKDVKTADEEIRQALAAQSARLDRALADQRPWTFSVWRERYLGHPVLGNLTRRLIWTFDGYVGLPLGDTIQNAEGGAIEGLEDDTEVRLWHPINAVSNEVQTWRDRLESLGIVQPFKQAHREVYLLTDAERTTNTYSNRFAAHILKQHQFNSLCVLRGWKNSLRLMVDDSYPPATRILPQYHMRVEFWVEGIGDDYGVDTNDAGTYLRLVTDQVRFYRQDAPTNYAHAGGGGYGANWRGAPTEALPLSEIPALVFSECLRDVDLFVGVASLGNDPNWSDGGPTGRFRNYWHDYAFGDLSASAKTRADVLARLLPRLKIAKQCTLDGKFLRVQGQIRAYQIHLGSGNILMEPNDQYLCIVPDRRTESGVGGTNVFLPFDGDQMLSVILSKAFLLADDTSIQDPTIVSQLRR